MALEVMPLAVTMMAGPQIMSDIIFLTGDRPVRKAIAFVAAVTLAVTAGVALALALVDVLDIDLGSDSDSGSTGKVIQYALIGLLVLAAIKNFVRRETIEPPKWLGTLQEADERKAFTTGLLVILLMPSDIIVMLTVATNLDQTGSGFVDALPFIAATVLVAALPLLTYLLFGSRARAAMPRIRDWMNDNSWLVNIIVCGIFILLIAG